MLLVRSESLSPYSGSYYSTQLLAIGYTHVVTLYLPPSANGSTWISDQYGSRVVAAIERWKPETVVSTEIDLSVFQGLPVEMQKRVVSVKPVELLDVARSSFKKLHSFLTLTGISDRKFYLLYRPEFGSLYDDIVREAGFDDLEAIQVSTLGDLRTVLSKIPRSPNVAVINALPYVEDIEFNYAVMGKQLSLLVRGSGVLDISVIESAPASITVFHADMVINIEKATVTQGQALLSVSPRRLRELGLKEVYVVGFREIDSITQ